MKKAVILSKQIFVAMLLLRAVLCAQNLQGDAVVKALRQGGYVIVMRHSSSPRDVPDARSVNPDNTKRERQLDGTGRATATAMGNALRDMKIPIGAVLSSPTYRALETVKFARLGNPQTYAQLGDNGQSMQGGTEAQAEWLRKKVTEFPVGTNTIIVTHLPNIAGAFPADSMGLVDGEALIFGADPQGGSRVVARIRIEQWAQMDPGRP